MDLGQDFSDTAYIFFVFFYNAYFLIIILLFYVMLSLYYVLLLHYMLVLFPSFGASYGTGYLFILPIFAIVKLNVPLLLCISIYSIACASYFIHCEILVWFIVMVFHLVFIH